MSDSQSAAPMSIAQQDGLQPLNEQRLHKNSGWRLYLQTVFARAYPRLIGQQREKSWLFFDILMPLLSVFAYVFVYRAIGAPEDYIGFVVVGGAMIAFWMNVLWSMSSQLYWERNRAIWRCTSSPRLR
jgi:ABC-2 type transport system permease protein